MSRSKDVQARFEPFAFQLRRNLSSNKTLHLTAIPLRSIAAGELQRSHRLRRRECV
jgi:hypothetical protein